MNKYSPTQYSKEISEINKECRLRELRQKVNELDEELSGVDMREIYSNAPPVRFPDNGKEPPAV